MHPVLRGALALLVLLSASEARAAKLMVVLPLDVSHAKGKIDADAQASVEEMLRDVATNALNPQGWTILTGETTLRVLEDNGVDAATCGEQNCHLSMAREIKADKFIGGAVQFVEGEFTASIRLIDTASARVLATERVNGLTVRSLRESFEKASEAFFKRAGILGDPASETKPADAPVTPAPVAEAKEPIQELKKGCASKVMADCNRLGVDYQKGRGVTKDEPRAVTYYLQACEGNFRSGCFNLGTLYWHGRGIAQDLVRAVGLFQRACDKGHSKACYALALSYRQGTGGLPKDVAKSFALNKKACDGGDDDGCTNLGNAYHRGEGTALDLSLALAAYQKACDGGNEVGCFNLANAYRKGLGTGIDPVRAAALYKRACAAGHKKSCEKQ